MKVFALTIGVMLTASIVGCGSSPPPELFVYHDLRCGVTADGGTGCEDVGDGLSHPVCTSDSQCTREVPFCRTLGLYKGGDFICNGSVRICRPVDHDDCT